MTKEPAKSNQHSVLVKKLVFITLLMFAFGFALVPLYDVFCEITGLNGKTSQQAASNNNNKIDESRFVTVQFITRTAKGIPWLFEAKTKQIRVHPGEVKNVSFFAKNQAGIAMVAQAIPSVSPGEGAQYFHKIACFCFNHQPLASNEEVDMGLQFYIDVDLPKDIKTLTLSYTLYDITEQENEENVS